MLAHLLLLMKDKQFYYKIIATILAIAMLPVLIISIVSYYNSKVTMEKELSNSNFLYLSQTANAVEIVMKQIDDNGRQLMLDPAVKDFANFPNGQYYERLKAGSKPDDMAALAAYMERKAKLVQRLNVLRMSNNYIDSILYYDAQKRIILADEGNQSSFDEFPDKEWLDIYNETGFSPVITDNRALKLYGRPGSNVISMIYRTFNNHPDNNISMIINLNADSIYQNIFKKLDDTSEKTFFVLSKAGAKVFREGSGGTAPGISDEAVLPGPAASRSGFFEVNRNGLQYMVTYTTSDFLGWKFVSVKNIKSLYRSTMYIKGIIFIASLAILFLIILLAFISGRSIYKPINSLSEYIKSSKKYSEGVTSAEVSDLKLISSSLKEAFEEREDLQERLYESIPAYRDKFICSLVRNPIYSGEEIKKRWEQLDIAMELEGFFVIVVAVYDLLPAKEHIKEKIIRKLRIREYIEEKISGTLKGIVAELDEERLLALLNTRSDNRSQIFVISNEISEGLKKSCNTGCTIGISRFCEDIPELGRGYEEAVEAMRYRIARSDGDIIYIEDVRIEKTGCFAYPKKKEYNMGLSIKKGEKEDAHKIFNAFIEEISSQEPGIHYNHFRHAFIQLYSSILGIMNELGLNSESILCDYPDFNDMLLKRSEPEVIAWFRAVIDKVVESILKATGEKNNKYAEEIKNILEKECGGNITLLSVAERLSLNPSYVSRIFKESTGKTFVEYMTHVRIEKGKRLLMDTDLSVKDIGESVGYFNSNYFIKIFKELVGNTPGEYRNLFHK